MLKLLSVCLVSAVLNSAPALAGPANAARTFPNHCAEGLKNFPQLKPWAEKLSNFKNPIEAGGSETSYFYGVGATWTSKNAAELWMKEQLTLDLSVHQKAGRLETVWLGPMLHLPEKSLVKPGPDEWIKGATSEALKNLGAEGYWKRFWMLLLAPVELDLLGKCKKDNCKIKFSDAELEKLSKVSDQYRINVFRDVLQKRINDYVTRGEVWSYEDTLKPLPWAEMPVSDAFLAHSPSHFTMPGERTNFGYEYLDAEPGKHKPVLALFSRSCEKRGSGSKVYTACSDIVIYNNHYFDFWARMVYFYPWCDGQIALVYETLDVDQIKGSRIVRILFGGQMRKSLETLVETRLNRVHVLGSTSNENSH